MRALPLVLCLALAGCTSPRSPEQRAQGVLEADRARSRAMVEVTRERLEELLHDELTYSHSNGRVDHKTALIEKLVAGDVDYQLIDSTDPQVRIQGTTGIVTGPTKVRLGVGERTLELTGVYTAVYWLEYDQWRLIAYHSSPVRS